MNLRQNTSANARFARVALSTIVGLTLTGQAWSQVYKWTDPDGRVVISDTPPTGANAKQLSKGGAEPPPKAPATAASADQTKKGGAPEAPSAADKAQAEKAAAEKQRAQAEYCAAARTRLYTLQSGQRLTEVGADGERSFMSDQAREAEINRTRAGMLQQQCP